MYSYIVFIVLVLISPYEKNDDKTIPILFQYIDITKTGFNEIIRFLSPLLKEVGFPLMYIC